MQFLNLTMNKYLLSLALLLSSHFIQASGDGSCEEYSFPLQSDGKLINSVWPLRVLRNNAPVYFDANGDSKKTTLKFGEALDAIRISDRRVAICKFGCLPGEVLGWMDRQDLLCRIYPLQNAKGLERLL